MQRLIEGRLQQEVNTGAVKNISKMTNIMPNNIDAVQVSDTTGAAGCSIAGKKEIIMAKNFCIACIYRRSKEMQEKNGQP